MDKRNSGQLCKTLIAGATSSIMAGAPIAAASPPVDKAAPSAKVENVDGKVLRLESLQGKVVVVVYEDKESAATNQAFKDDLTRLLGEDALKDKVFVTPVADVSEYGSWPMKGFAKDAIRDQSKKSGTTIWCDWDASFRKALSLPKGTSSVVVIDRHGVVRMAVDGALTEVQRKRAAQILRAVVAG